MLGITVSDNKDGNLTLSDIQLTGIAEFDNNTPGEYFITYTLTDRSGNTTIITRKITVVVGVGEPSWTIANGDFAKGSISRLSAASYR
ncbi:MAG: DUF5011 domain-containing protein [Bacillus subtilis]|nr:DUF5011 domain-containing protein [Bacillus subtilis]